MKKVNTSMNFKIRFEPSLEVLRVRTSCKHPEATINKDSSATNVFSCKFLK